MKPFPVLTVPWGRTGVARRPQLARPPTARIAATTTMTALALLAAACSSPSSSNAAGSASSSPAVAYSNCMRSHAVPRFPDPDPRSGAVPKGGAQQFGVSSSVFSTAQTACAHLLSASSGSIQTCEETGDCPPAVVQAAVSIMRRYAQCLRSHGVPNWPDPTIDSEGRPFFNASGAGITYQYTHSSAFESKDQICERLVGGSAGVPVPIG